MSAQEALPDVATIDAPMLTPPPSPSDESDNVKFFYLAKAGVSFREAYDDLVDCYRFLDAGPPLHLPGYVPWREAAHRQDKTQSAYDPAYPSGGVVQSALAAVFLPMIDAVIARNLAMTKLRRCMTTRGYRRFAVSKDIWLQIHKGTVREALLRQAKLASTGKSPAATVAP
ncbi:hypothetical protein ABC974_05745 [Sphingomonas oligophenolica]|uniref:Uncharacterized protein n=1 Tax=Sphingomonas oligophenolica TaxID=301154 RepID=A0ABU9XZY6_9SPHN